MCRAGRGQLSQSAAAQHCTAVAVVCCMQSKATKLFFSRQEFALNDKLWTTCLHKACIQERLSMHNQACCHSPNFIMV